MHRPPKPSLSFAWVLQKGGNLHTALMLRHERARPPGRNSHLEIQSRTPNNESRRLCWLRAVLRAHPPGFTCCELLTLGRWIRPCILSVPVSDAEMISAQVVAVTRHGRQGLGWAPETVL